MTPVLTGKRQPMTVGLWSPHQALQAGKANRMLWQRPESPFPKTTRRLSLHRYPHALRRRHQVQAIHHQEAIRLVVQRAASVPKAP